jgi:hypothetical protein
MSRDYRFLDAAGITLAVDVQDGQARVALAACNPEDSFSRATGKDVVNTLLDSNSSTLRAFNLKKNVVAFPYDKEKPRQHILKPLLDYLADELRERMHFRQLHSMFMSGITSREVAIQVAKETMDESIYYNFKAMSELLEEDSLELLEVLEDEHQFYQAFFDWRGSVNCIMRCLRRFASAVHTKDIILKDAPPEDASKKRVAPRRSEPEQEAAPEPERERAFAATPVKTSASKDSIPVEN